MSLARIAAEVGTPFYCYSTATIERHYNVLAHAFRDQDALICFAVKANSNQAVLATMARLGAGMDVVSEGELRRALALPACRRRRSFSQASARRAPKWPMRSKRASSGSTSRANLSSWR